MQQDYSFTANAQQFIQLAEIIRSELHRKGRDVITIKRGRPQSYVAIGGDGKKHVTRTVPFPDADVEILIRGESEAAKDKGVSVIVKDWDGETSRLIVQYRDAEDWEVVKDTWQIFEERIKEKGWKLMPKSMEESVQASSEISANGNGTMASIELTISGTPYEFATIAIDFGEKQRAANPDAPRYYISNVPRVSIAPNQSPFYRSIANTEIDYAALQNSSRLIIKCVQGGGLIDGKYEAENHLGELIALKIPNDGTRLRVVIDTENAAAFSQEWELLHDRMIQLGIVQRLEKDMAENTQSSKKIELEANGKGTDVGAAVEHLLSLQNNYACSVRWLNGREDREPHRKQTIRLEYAESGFDERFGQPYHRTLSQAHIEISPKPSGSHITFMYPTEHEHIYIPFWSDLYKLMNEWDILANSVRARIEQTTKQDAPTLTEVQDALFEAECEVELIKLDLGEKQENDWAEIPERFWRGNERKLRQNLYAAERKRLEAQTQVNKMQAQTIVNAPAPTEQPTWGGNGVPPKTKAEKIRAVRAWDTLNPDERPRLETWLLENFGNDPATGALYVPPSTFRGWRNLKG